MKKMEITVLRAHRYGGKLREKGTNYSLPEKMARLLCAIGKARIAEPTPEPAPAPRRRGRPPKKETTDTPKKPDTGYNTREMKAAK